MSGSRLAVERLHMSAEQAVPRTQETDALAALGRGDTAGAIRLLMSLYGGPLYRYCCHLTGDRDVAEDVLQLTFLHAYQDLPRFAQRSSLRSWLYGIARHRCLDALKAARRRRKRFVALDDVAPQSLVQSPQPGLTDDAVHKGLARCLNQLDPLALSAVMLRFQEGLSYVEMAQICGERAATLQARVARALPALRRCLEKHGLQP